MAKSPACPNCTVPVARSNEGCLLHDLIQVARDREDTPERKLRKLHATCDVDALWNHLGALVDDLQEGRFSD